jgi:hypothetical protein
MQTLSARLGAAASVTASQTGLSEWEIIALGLLLSHGALARHFTAIGMALLVGGHENLQ